MLSPKARVNRFGTWTVTSPAAQLDGASCQFLLSLYLVVFSTLHSHQHTKQCVTGMYLLQKCLIARS